MRIVHTLDYWAKGYGRPQAVQHLAEAQRQAGHEVHVLIGDCFGNADEQAFRHFRADEYNKKSIARSKNKAWKEWLLEEIGAISPDIIHAHEAADAWALAGNVSSPLLLSIRIDYRTLPNNQWMLEAARKTDWVEYWNPDIAGWLLQGGTENISWNCAPVVLSSKEHKPEPGLIVSQGRIDDLKNQRLLINAMPEVLEEVPHARLHLVGNGPAFEDLQVLVSKLALADAVTFLGWQEDPAPFLARASLAAYPSREMGFDRAITEAMTIGVPVITSKALSPAIHYGRYGVVAEENEWPAKITAALKQSPGSNHAAKRWAQEHCSPKAVLRRTLRLYNQLLG